MPAARGVPVNRSELRYLAWQAARRLGRDHPSVSACREAEFDFDPIKVEHALRLLDQEPGIAGRHLRAVFYGR
jgi:hypothetical protein